MNIAPLQSVPLTIPIPQGWRIVGIRKGERTKIGRRKYRQSFMVSLIDDVGEPQSATMAVEYESRMPLLKRFVNWILFRKDSGTTLEIRTRGSGSQWIN